MSKPVQQIISDAINDFIAQRRSVAEIVEAVKRDFSLRDEALAAADALLASPDANLRAAGKIVEVTALNWTSETPTSYLRGTNILINKPCTCADPRAVDRTCPLYGTPDHAAIVARRWVDRALRGEG